MYKALFYHKQDIFVWGILGLYHIRLIKKSVKNDKTIDLQGFFYYNTRVRSLESEEHRLEKD